MSSTGRHRLVRRGLLSAVVGVLVCVVLAAPVSAFVSRATRITIVPDLPAPTIGSYRVTFGSSTATCPPGQHVLFGGFKWGMSGMRRTASNRWTVYGWNVSIFLEGANNSPLSMSSMAYCGYGPVPSKATSTVEIRRRAGVNEAFGSATARCPAGTVVVAGGFATTPNTAVAVTGLERVAADLWRVSADMRLDITNAAVTSIAYCGPGPAPKLVSRTIKNYVSGPVRVTCPAGKHLVFGGAIAKGNAYLTTLRARTQSTWTVGGSTQYGTTLTALAYCR